MSLTRFYGYKDKVVIPTVAQAEDGFYFDEEPVTVCDAGDDTLVRESLLCSLAKPNKVVPTPERSEPRQFNSPVLDALGLKKWLTFEKDATMYSVYVRGDAIDYYCSGNAVNGSWTSGQARHVSFETAAGLEAVVDRLINDVRFDQKSRCERKVGGLALLPPPAET